MFCLELSSSALERLSRIFKRNQDIDQFPCLYAVVIRNELQLVETTASWCVYFTKQFL
jgi:hypothetical protein